MSKKAKVISICINKGGTAKSTTAMELAYGLTVKGKKVLLVDLDPSANTSSIVLETDKMLSEQGALVYKEIFDGLMAQNMPRIQACYDAMHLYLQHEVYPCDIHDVLEQQLDLHNAIYPSRFERLDIVPSSNALSTTDLKLKESYNRSNRLRKALQCVEYEYDYIIIDGQPFENSLTYNAITSCYKEGDLIIAPTKLSLGGLQGIDTTLKMLLDWYKEVEALPYDFKVLITMKNRNNVDDKWTNVIKDTFSNFVFNTVIRYQGKPVADASMNRKLLLEDGKSGVAEDYQALVDEILAME